MNPETPAALRAAANKTREALVAITEAYGKTQAAWQSGGPNFMHRTETLRQQIENLASDLDSAAGPQEAHQGIRDVIAHDDDFICSDPDCRICFARAAG